MITSKSNQTVKKARLLSDKKYRDAEGLYLVESVKLVNEAIATGAEVVEIIATPSCDKLKTFDREVLTVSEEVFKSISTEKTPEGALAILKKPVMPVKSPEGSCLFLDGVSDPANVGAIIRTAAAVGITEIYTAGGADAFSPKSVRASMGGIFRVKIYSGEREELLSQIDKPLIVADMKGENVFGYKKGGDFCLIIGSESHGVSEELKKRADKTVSIPMQNGMESLNAAVSAGILMYELKSK